MYSFCKKSAFTLLELVITLTVIAILCMIALPHYHDIRERQEVGQLLSLIRQNVNLSKSLASAHHTKIVICSSANLSTCEDNQWHKGMIIFMDLNQNHALDPHEPIQKIIKTDIQYGSFQWKGGIVNSHTITFQNDSGLPRGSQGSFHYCSFNHPKNNRSIVVSPMGHTRIEVKNDC